MTQPGRLATLHSTNTISPTLFNEASFAVSQNTLNLRTGVSRPGQPHQTRHRYPAAQPRAEPAESDSAHDLQQRSELRQSVARTTATPYFNQNTIYSFIDNVSKVHGTHVFKMGIYFEHTQKIQSASVAEHGQHQLQYRRQQSE